MIPTDHLVEAIGHLAAAISELNEMACSIPADTPKLVTSEGRIRELAGSLDEVHILATSELGDIMFYNKHHEDNGQTR